MKSTEIVLSVVLSFLLQLMPVYGNSTYLRERWREIAEGSASDIQQKDNFYKALKEKQGVLANLLLLVEQDLKAKNIEILANSINSNDTSTAEATVKKTLKDMKNNFDIQEVDSIFAEALNKAISLQKLLLFYDVLWGIFKQNELELFDPIVRGQLQVCSNLMKKTFTDKPKFLQKFAYTIYIVGKKPANMSLCLKTSIISVLTQLPNNLKHIYFKNFCLLNVKYLNYIYTATEAKVDNSSRYIWLWHKNKSMDSTGYIEAKFQEFDSTREEKLKVRLMGTRYKMYYYMMNSTNMVAGWEPSNGIGETPINSIWSIDFLNDELVLISQNDFYMCAEENYDKERRYIRGRNKSNASSRNSECQWRLGNCDFN